MHQDQSVPQEQKELWESRVDEVLLESREPQEDPEVQDQLDPPVTKDVKERLAHQDPEVQQEPQEHVDHKDLPEILVNQDKLVPKVTLDQVEQKEQLDTKEQPDHEVAMDQKVSSEQLDPLEPQEPQDVLAKQEKLDQTEKTVPLDQLV